MAAVNMHKSMGYLLITASVLALGVPMRDGQAQSQSLDCGADDEECLWDNLRASCEQRDSLAETCLDLVQRIEAHRLAAYPTWRVAAAYGHHLAARLTRSEEAAERLWAESRSIFEEVIVTWPDSYSAGRAYMGLATLAIRVGDIDERISSLRNSLRLKPNRTTMTILADALTHRRGDGDMSEAADLYRRAYLESGDPPTWAFALRALGLYASSGETDQEAAFKDQLARESGMAGFADEIASESFAQDLGRAAEVLETACNRFMAVIFGPGTCENGIDSMVVATRSIADPARRQAIADIATKAMREVSAMGGYTAVTAEEKNQRDYQFGAILQEWIQTGAATAGVYVLWAQNPNSDLDEGIAAFERAVELAPDNGRYRYWLAQGYIARGRYDEAIEHLNLARDTLPENVGLTPESVDRQIRIAELARSRTQ